MPNSNAVVTFDGLMVFYFEPQTYQGPLDVRNRCIIGLLHETGPDAHEFKIRVFEELPDGSSRLVTELKFGQLELKKLFSFHLFVGDCGDLPPNSGRVVREPSFDTVLNLNGKDFYQGDVAILWNKFTPLFVTDGSFSGVNETGDAEFCRVSTGVLQDVKNTLTRPNDWYTLLDSDRRMLGAFARKVRTEIEIGQGKYLVAKKEVQRGKFENVFCLPYPPSTGATGYVLEFTNLDKNLDPTSPDHIVKNCANFAHLCEAVTVPQLASQAIFGLTYNFDYVYLIDDELTEDTERCDDACCVSGEVRSSLSSAPGGGKRTIAAEIEEQRQ